MDDVTVPVRSTLHPPTHTNGDAHANGGGNQHTRCYFIAIIVATLILGIPSNCLQGVVYVPSSNEKTTSPLDCGF